MSTCRPAGLVRRCPGPAPNRRLIETGKAIRGGRTRIIKSLLLRDGASIRVELEEIEDRGCSRRAARVTDRHWPPRVEPKVFPVARCSSLLPLIGNVDHCIYGADYKNMVGTMLVNDFTGGALGELWKRVEAPWACLQMIDF